MKRRKFLEELSTRAMMAAAASSAGVSGFGPSLSPELGHPPPEWHLSAQTKRKREATYIIAALGISKAGEKPRLTDVRDLSDGKVVTLQFRYAGKLIKAAFDLAAPAVDLA